LRAGVGPRLEQEEGGGARGNVLAPIPGVAYTAERWYRRRMGVIRRYAPYPPKVFEKFTGWLERNGRAEYNIKIYSKNVDKILLEDKNENYTVFEF
jgi:hypothetical protein